MDKVALHLQFGSAVRKARLEKGLSLRDAATKIGVSPAYLSSLELNKEGQIPTDQMIRRISSVVGINFAALRELTMHITHDLRAMRKKLNPIESEHMQAFYRVMKQHNITTKRGLDLFISAVEVEDAKSR